MTEGLTIAIIKYDSLGRRIVKDVEESGDWDEAYHYFYNGQSMVEMRNGSDDVIKQYVWGLTYVDELLQIGINDDPADEGEDDCETFYYVLQDANFNVLGIVEADGDLKERYEYSPYGQRTVYKSAGSDDPLCMSPIMDSQPVVISSVDQPYGLCDIGHQGLLHDKEFSLIYNRARYFSPTLGRFISRDPLMYINGMSLYEYVRSQPVVLLDPFGLAWYHRAFLWSTQWVEPAQAGIQWLWDEGRKKYLPVIAVTGGGLMVDGMRNIAKKNPMAVKFGLIELGVGALITFGLTVPMQINNMQDDAGFIDETNKKLESKIKKIKKYKDTVKKAMEDVHPDKDKNKDKKDKAKTEKPYPHKDNGQ